MFAVSDPRRGTGPSVLNNNEILREVSLYYLTESFVSSVYMYYQNPNNFTSHYTKAQTDAPLLFSDFKYNVYYWAKPVVEMVGNLVYYKCEWCLRPLCGFHPNSNDNADVMKLGNLVVISLR